jgi:hypothetical protein
MATYNLFQVRAILYQGKILESTDLEHIYFYAKDDNDARRMLGLFIERDVTTLQHRIAGMSPLHYVLEDLSVKIFWSGLFEHLVGGPSDVLRPVPLNDQTELPPSYPTSPGPLPRVEGT